MDGLPLGHRNLSDYESYHHAMAQHAAVVSAANNTSLHPAMAAQLSMLPAGLNLSINSAAAQSMSSGLSAASLVNSNAGHLSHHHHLGGAGGYGGGGGTSHKAKNKKPKVNKDGVPAPKRATTAYINFTQWYREELKKTGRQIPRIGDFGKECAGKWNSMNEDEKEPFLEKAARDKERYKREMAVYKPARDANKPKRPGTAFMLFMADFRKTMAGKEPEGGVAALAKLGGEKWRGMAEEEKRPYVEKQNEEKLRYEQSMEDYRRKSAEPVTLPPVAKQPRLEESSQESCESNDGTMPSVSSHVPVGGAQSTPTSGNSTPVSLSASPPAQTQSPGSGNSSGSSGGSPPTTSASGSGSAPLAQLPSLSLPHALMGPYGQPPLPSFAHSGSVLAAAATAQNYTQAHAASTLASSGSPYLPSSGATYTQAHLPGPYSWN